MWVNVGGWESWNFLRGVSKSSLTVVRSFWSISSGLNGGEVGGVTSGCTLGGGG